MAIRQGRDKSRGLYREERPEDTIHQLQTLVRVQRITSIRIESLIHAIDLFLCWRAQCVMSEDGEDVVTDLACVPSQNSIAISVAHVIELHCLPHVVAALDDLNHPLTMFCVRLRDGYQRRGDVVQIQIRVPVRHRHYLDGLRDEVPDPSLGDRDWMVGVGLADFWHAEQGHQSSLEAAFRIGHRLGWAKEGRMVNISPEEEVQPDVLVPLWHCAAVRRKH